MIRLTLICCGSTEATRRSAFPSDEPLDDRARNDAAALALRLFDRALSSPALSARQTAEALRLQFGLDPLLAEIDYGAWAGKTLDEMRRQDPEGVAVWLKDPEQAPHSGESIAALIARVDRWMRREISSAGHLTAVTHSSVIRAAIVRALDAPISAFWRIDVRPLARIVLRGDGKAWRLRALVPRISDSTHEN